MMWEMRFLDWLREALLPNTPHPPSILGADAPDVVQASRESRRRREMFEAARRRHEESQEQRLRDLERRVNTIFKVEDSYRGTER